MDLFGKKLTEKELQAALHKLEMILKGYSFSLNLKNKSFYEVIDPESEAYRAIKNEVESKWKTFQERNSKYVIEKTYTTFFYDHFNQFFTYFITHFFGLHAEEALTLKAKEKVSSRELLLEYSYSLSQGEEAGFQEYIQKSENNHQPVVLYIFYLYFIVFSLNTLLKELIHNDFEVLLEGAKLYRKKGRTHINFLIIIKENRQKFHNYYYKMALYFFFKQFKGIPKNTFDKLEKQKNELFDFALSKYDIQETRKRLVDLLYYFYKKCIFLDTISPILDFLNFICSRVEDSKYDKIEIIKKEYLSNFSYPNGIKGKLLEIFKFLDQKSSTSSTFLANNLPSLVNQVNLFLLYNKFFLGSGLEALEANLLFLPSKFKETFDEYNLNNENTINSKTIININQISNFFPLLSEKEQFNLFFQKIFGKEVSDFNQEFFSAFFNSLNEKFFQIIREKKDLLSEDFSDKNGDFDYSFVMNHICRMLYVLIDKLFLKESPHEASKNFIDPYGRYVGKNIALRVLELELFQDMNFSDDLWPDFLISWNNDKVKKKLRAFNIKASEEYFYSRDQLNRFFITYNFQLSPTKIYLEEWRIDELIEPMNNFIAKINSSLDTSDNQIEIYEKLCDFFTEGVRDEEKINEIKRICQTFASLWDIVN